MGAVVEVEDRLGIGFFVAAVVLVVLPSWGARKFTSRDAIMTVVQKTVFSCVGLVVIEGMRYDEVGKGNP